MKHSLTLAVLLTLPAAIAQNATLPVQPLGPDDLVVLTVANSQELSHQFRVSPDGKLHLPQLAAPIPANRRYPQDVQEDIRKALIEQRLFVNPTVSLAVAEYASRPVTVMGAVRRPTTFQATAQTTLLEALAKAEGMAPEAGETVMVTRPGIGGAEPEITKVPVRLLLEDGPLTQNIRLYGGEQVRVPEAPRVYVLGNVKRNCVIPVKDLRETTLLRVLTQAEGLANFSASEGVIYRRRSDGDGRESIVVDVKRILKGKSPDVQLQPYDVLYIPEAKGRRLTAEVIDRMAGFGVSTVRGYLIFK